MSKIKRIQDLKITNYLTKQLKQDPETPGLPLMPSKNSKASISQRQVLNSHFSFVQPTPPPNPNLLSFNATFARLVGLDPTAIQDPEFAQEWINVLSGVTPLPNSNAWALCYGGHQFGSWAGQLGDGRAISLAQFQHQDQLWELQLKGAGLTPYSRFADGLAVVRSSIREYLCAEAMNALGVPTSRSLSLITTDQDVERETIEKAAIVCRVAPSWIRLGSFEIFFARNDLDSIEQLADYVIKYHFPNCEGGQKYTDWAIQVVEKTAEMIGKWQAVGFCHGVMNTDNFSILGITIDYGPFQFLDQYDPLYICNHSDHTGRYAFMEQPRVALWNLLRFCNAIHHLLEPELSPNQTIQEKMYQILGHFTPKLQTVYNDAMCQKLGFENGSKEKMDQIVQPLLILLEEAEMDYSLFFRWLTNQSLEQEISEIWISQWRQWSYLDEFDSSLDQRFREWFESYRQLRNNVKREIMLKANPKFILRNHIVQEVIEKAENGDKLIVDQYLRVLQSPFDEHGEEEERLFGGKVPSHKRDVKCSCSS
jgi:uncharacterized protein YdiU (UPF0061 family)